MKKKMNETQKKCKMQTNKMQKMKCKENAKKCKRLHAKETKRGLNSFTSASHTKDTRKKRNCLITPKSFPYHTNLEAYQLTHFGSSAPIQM